MPYEFLMLSVCYICMASLHCGAESGRESAIGLACLVVAAIYLIAQHAADAERAAEALFAAEGKPREEEPAGPTTGDPADAVGATQADD